MAQTSISELTAEAVNRAVQAILFVLDKLETELHQLALAAFEQGDSATVKRLSSTHLSNHYCKALGYLVSAPKLMPNTDTIVAEAARSAADFARERILAQLSYAITEALGDTVKAIELGELSL